jgi:hypothetical protein
VRVRFQALLIGLILSSAAAVAFAVGPGSEAIRTRQVLPPRDVAKLTTIAAKEAAELYDHPRRATIVGTTDSALARFNHEPGLRPATRIYLLILNGGPATLLYGQNVRARFEGPTPGRLGMATVYEFRARDLSQLDYGFGVPGLALTKLGPSVDVQLR